jgi:hypothetical protein
VRTNGVADRAQAFTQAAGAIWIVDGCVDGIKDELAKRFGS